MRSAPPNIDPFSLEQTALEGVVCRLAAVGSPEALQDLPLQAPRVEDAEDIALPGNDFEPNAKRTTTSLRGSALGVGCNVIPGVRVVCLQESEQPV